MELGAAVSLLLAACISCLLFITAWRKMFQRGNLPPGPVPLPLVGNLLQLKGGDVVRSLLALREAYGPVFTVYMGSRPNVVICGYNALKEAFIDQVDDFVARGFNPVLDRLFHGYGVSIANDERWKQLRQFTIMTLKDFGMGKRLMEEMIQEEMRNMVEVYRNSKGVPCDPTLALHSAAANVIFVMVFGERYDYEDEKMHTMFNTMSEGFAIMCSIWGQLYDMFPGIMYYLPGPHNRMFTMLKVLEDFLIEKTKSHQETLDVNSPRDFIDCYLIRKEQEKQNPASEFHIPNLIPTIMDLVLGGVDTVSTTLKHGLLFLLKYPHVEEKIHQEIDREIGQHRSPSYEDRTKMPYTYAVIHEIQRLADIFPMSVSHAATHNTQFRGYTIPKGMDVIPMLTTVLHDPTQFQDPEHFNPEHFLDENGCFKKNSASVPFSFGKRNCLGEGMARMEIFLFLTTILQNFNLKSPVDPKDIDLTPLVTGIGNLPQPYKMSFIPR